jgi:hypothetical protein
LNRTLTSLSGCLVAGCGCLKSGLLLTTAP